MIRVETNRLLLRDLEPADAEGIFRMDSNADVHRYIGNRPLQHKDEAIRVVEIIRKQYVDYGIGRWAVIEKETGDFTGWGGLKWMDFEANGHIHYYDVGYRFMPQYWGKGYATEVATAAVAYGLNTLKTNKINGMAHVDNIASRKVLEKIGLQFSGLFDYEDEPHAWHAYPPGG
ncbi:MAG TPA: GNAT family N-acetyltransferase [Flavipsychrobacter sp.]